MLLAVMDLGSNSFKMTVAQWSPEISKRRPFRILHKERHPIQLGSSVFASGKISTKDFRLALKVLEKMQARLRDFSSPILRVVATSAIRDAHNGKEFVAAVKLALGLPIEVISGVEEASLIAEGLALEYPRVKRGLLIDIGGGSMEIASFGTDKSAQEKFCHSYRAGSVRLATQFFKNGNRKNRDLAKIRHHIALLLKARSPHKADKLVGSAGTIQSLGQIFCGGAKNKVIRKSILDKWIEQNLRSSIDELGKKYKLQQSRARVIVPGAIVLSEAMRWLNATELTVTGMTLRDGVMVDLVQQWNSDTARTLQRKSGTEAASFLDNAISDRELLGFLKETVSYFHGNLSHASHTAQLAVSLYDQMAGPRAPFLPEERKLLLAACFLHDIGKSISDASHHKHSAYIIRNLKIPGFSTLESKKVALIALFHRKETPAKKDPLPLEIRGVHADQVRRLTAVLRLIDGLDKESSQNTDSIRIRFSKKQAVIELTQWEPEQLNLNYFRDKAAYFEQLFECRIVPFVHHKRRGSLSLKSALKIGAS